MHTHTFELKMDDTEIEGELEFSESGKVYYKTTGEMPSLTIEQMGVFNDLFVFLKKVKNSFGDIDKLEVNKV